MLVSSILIYNSFGVIEESTIEQFASMIQAVELINQKNKQKKGEDIISDFPSLLWVLRDFSLDLGLQTSADYMEDCLRAKAIPQDANQAAKRQIESKNLLRQLITKFFEKRSCFTLSRPIDDENKLARIHELEEDQLKQEFVDEMRRFLQYMSLNINPKTLCGNSMTGGVFVNYLDSIVTALNQGETPYVGSMAERLFEYENRNIVKKFEMEVEKFCSDYEQRLPVSPGQLDSNFEDFLQSVVRQFRQKTEGYSSIESFARNLEKLIEFCYKRLARMREVNENKSIKKAESSMNQFIADYKVPNVVNRESFDEDMISRMKENFERFVHMFISDNKGPASSEKCLETVPIFLFETFNSLYHRILDVYSQECKDLKAEMNQTTGSNDRLKEFMKDQEKMVLDLTRAKNKLADENERLKHDIERFEKSKEMEMEALQDSINRLGEKAAKQTAVREDLKNKVKELEEKLLDTSEKLTAKQKEAENLKRKVESSEKMILEYSKNLQVSGAGRSEEDTNGLYEMIKFLNKQVENLNVEVRTRNQTKLNKLNQKLEKKDSEIKELLEERQRTVLSIRTEYSKKIKDLKAMYEERIEELEKKVKVEYEQNKKYKVELFEKKKLELELKRADMLKEELNERIKSLEDSNKAKDEKSEINQETFTKFIKQIETIKLEKNSFEDKLMQFKEQALNSSHELNNIVSCVNNVVSKGRDKTLIAHMIKKLAPDSIKKLKPFFGVYKIRV